MSNAEKREGHETHGKSTPKKGCHQAFASVSFPVEPAQDCKENTRNSDDRSVKPDTHMTEDLSENRRAGCYFSVF